ncbi:hypothetical protein [Jeotgalibaca caeni]|uniref:hypothetical protein n=1 Tax=Jeotgalibaca caeni TaxID=3028623 RepID=UPI00237DC8A3|nr:hypothetical protein [Jeotgalibaca caeni]MDE1548530.1 hypothetical protein [Jeotgalibaca caeni]
MKIKFSFTDQNYQELVQRANFLGISRTAAILLHLYLYEEAFSDLSQDDLQVKLDVFEPDRNTLQVLVPDALVATYENHKTYFLSRSAYFTGFLNAVLTKTTGKWRTSALLLERTPTTVNLDEKIANQVEAFSQQTGLQFSVIATYYLAYAPLDVEGRPCEATEKVQFGVRLTDWAHIRLKERAYAMNQKPNQVLSIGFQDFLQKKIFPRGY